ncbi:MAG: hypothetical protein IJJ50_07125 [Lachnospiraceae bacterium]|nr:hypothetical protein [Lachnospiraceae bacterium]
MSMIKIGWAEADITPDKKVSLAGQFAERISEYVEKPLTATALAIESGGEQAVFVSTDLVGVSINLVEAIRDRIGSAAEKAGLDPMKVMISAIHTHTAPVYPRITECKRAGSNAAISTAAKDILIDLLPEGRKYVESAPVTDNPEIISQEETFELLVSRISKAILDAWDARSDGSFSNAFGRASVGHCRRVVYSDGSAQMWGDTNTAVFEEVECDSDDGIELLFMKDGKGSVTGIVANIACPAQCVQHRLFVSPDYWGEVKVRLRKYFGDSLYLLPLCAPAGCQCPVDMVRWVAPESDVNDPNIEHPHPLKRKADPSMFDISGMKVTGRRIASEIIAVYEEGLDEAQKDVEFKHEVEIMELPLRRATLADYEKARKGVKEYLKEHPGDVNFYDAAKMQVDLGILSRFKLQEYMNVVPIESHILRLGTVAFSTNPFELFLKYGNQIRVRSKAEQTILIQLCNGTEGYLPTAKAERGGHYSAFISSGECGHEGGDLFVRKTLEHINKMFPEVE